MKETYTFATALRMMRYGGKKMKPTYMMDGRWYYVVKNKLFTGQIYELTMPNFPTRNTISYEDIMGSWEEVK
jgi:hypothetical protein